MYMYMYMHMYMYGQYTMTQGVCMRSVYYDTRYVYELSILQCVLTIHCRSVQLSYLIQHIHISFTTHITVHQTASTLSITKPSCHQEEDRRQASQEAGQSVAEDHPRRGHRRTLWYIDCHQPLDPMKTGSPGAEVITMVTQYQTLPGAESACSPSPEP